MSDLQLSLIILGLLVVAGVYVFNQMQERRYRKKFEHAFDRGQEDVLLAPKPKVEPPVADVQVGPRIEPSLAEEPEAAAPAELPAPQAPPVVVREEPVVPPPREVLVGREPVAAAREAPDIDYCAHLGAKAPMSGATLAGLAKPITAIGKPVRIEVREGAEGEWRQMPAGGLEAVSEARVAMQLVDRNGPLSVAQLARFREMLQAAAGELGASVVFDDEPMALTKAAELDAFCVDNDVAIGLNIVPRDPAGLAGTKLRALAEASGFALAADGSFHLPDDRGGTAIALGSMDGVPFEAGSLKTLRSQGVTLLLDVPRVGEGRQVFRRMTELARHFAASLEGTVVDDKRTPLNQASLEKIARQIDTIQGALKARGISPGGPLALRLFH